MDKEFIPKVRILDALMLVAKSLQKDENIYKEDLPRIKVIAADLLRRHNANELQLSNQQYEAMITILGYKNDFSKDS